jgi:hypothetical protein
MATVTPVKRESDAGLPLARAVLVIAVLVYCVAQFAGARTAEETSGIPDQPIAVAQ